MYVSNRRESQTGPEYSTATYLEGDAKKIALAKKVTNSKKSTIFVLS